MSDEATPFGEMYRIGGRDVPESPEAFEANLKYATPQELFSLKGHFADRQKALESESGTYQKTFATISELRKAIQGSPHPMATKIEAEKALNELQERNALLLDSTNFEKESLGNITTLIQKELDPDEWEKFKRAAHKTLGLPLDWFGVEGLFWEEGDWLRMRWPYANSTFRVPQVAFDPKVRDVFSTSHGGFLTESFADRAGTSPSMTGDSLVDPGNTLVNFFAGGGPIPAMGEMAGTAFESLGLKGYELATGEEGLVATRNQQKFKEGAEASLSGVGSHFLSALVPLGEGRILGGASKVLAKVLPADTKAGKVVGRALTGARMTAERGFAPKAGISLAAGAVAYNKAPGETLADGTVVEPTLVKKVSLAVAAGVGSMVGLTGGQALWGAGKELGRPVAGLISNLAESAPILRRAETLLSVASDYSAGGGRVARNLLKIGETDPRVQTLLEENRVTEAIALRESIENGRTFTGGDYDAVTASVLSAEDPSSVRDILNHPSVKSRGLTEEGVGKILHEKHPLLASVLDPKGKYRLGDKAWERTTLQAARYQEGLAQGKSLLDLEIEDIVSDVARREGVTPESYVEALRTELRGVRVVDSPARETAEALLGEMVVDPTPYYPPSYSPGQTVRWAYSARSGKRLGRSQNVTIQGVEYKNGEYHYLVETGTGEKRKTHLISERLLEGESRVPPSDVPTEEILPILREIGPEFDTAPLPDDFPRATTQAPAPDPEAMARVTGDLANATDELPLTTKAPEGSTIDADLVDEGRVLEPEIVEQTGTQSVSGGSTSLNARLKLQELVEKGRDEGSYGGVLGGGSADPGYTIGRQVRAMDMGRQILRRTADLLDDPKVLGITADEIATVDEDSLAGMLREIADIGDSNPDLASAFRQATVEFSQARADASKNILKQSEIDAIERKVRRKWDEARARMGDNPIDPEVFQKSMDAEIASRVADAAVEKGLVGSGTAWWRVLGRGRQKAALEGAGFTQAQINDLLKPGNDQMLGMVMDRLKSDQPITPEIFQNIRRKAQTAKLERRAAKQKAFEIVADTVGRAVEDVAKMGKRNGLAINEIVDVGVKLWEQGVKMHPDELVKLVTPSRANKNVRKLLGEALSARGLVEKGFVFQSLDSQRKNVRDVKLLSSVFFGLEETVPAILRSIHAAAFHGGVTRKALPEATEQALQDLADLTRAVRESNAAEIIDPDVARGLKKGVENAIRDAVRAQEDTMRPSLFQEMLGMRHARAKRFGGPIISRLMDGIRNSVLDKRAYGQTYIDTTDNILGLFDRDAQGRIMSALDTEADSATTAAIKSLKDPHERMAAESLRAMFDRMLDLVNQTRVRVGKKPIARREGYFPHLFRTLSEEGFVPHAPQFGKKSIGFRFANMRKGKEGYVTDLRDVVNAYARAAVNYSLFQPHYETLRLLGGTSTAASVLDKSMYDSVQKILDMSSGRSLPLLDETLLKRVPTEVAQRAIRAASNIMTTGQVLVAMGASPASAVTNLIGGTIMAKLSVDTKYLGRALGHMIQTGYGMDVATGVAGGIVGYAAGDTAEKKVLGFAGGVLTGGLLHRKGLKPLLKKSGAWREIDTIVRTVVPDFERHGYDDKQVMMARSLFERFVHSPVAMGMFDATERYVKAQAALAGWYQAEAKGLTGKDQIEFARDVVQRTQGWYLPGDNPRLFYEGGTLTRPATVLGRFTMQGLDVMAFQPLQEAYRGMRAGQWAEFAPGGKHHDTVKNIITTAMLGAGTIYLGNQAGLDMTNASSFVPLEVAADVAENGLVSFVPGANMIGTLTRELQSAYMGRADSADVAEAARNYIIPAIARRTMENLQFPSFFTDDAPTRIRRLHFEDEVFISRSGYDTGVKATEGRKALKTLGFRLKATGEEYDLAASVRDKMDEVNGASVMQGYEKGRKARLLDRMASLLARAEFDEKITRAEREEMDEVFGELVQYYPPDMAIDRVVDAVRASIQAHRRTPIERALLTPGSNKVKDEARRALASDEDLAAEVRERLSLGRLR